MGLCINTRVYDTENKKRQKGKNYKSRGAEQKTKKQRVKTEDQNQTNLMGPSQITPSEECAGERLYAITILLQRDIAVIWKR